MRLDRPAAARLARALALAAALAPFVAGCGATQKTVVPPLPPLSRVVLTPAVDTLAVGSGQLFSAVAYDTNNVALSGAGFNWTTTNLRVCGVSSNGFVTAQGEGSALVIAEAGGKSDTCAVSVITQTGWYTQTSNTVRNLNGVCFLADGRTGWAVGDLGTIVATTDAGVTWTNQTSNTSNNLRSVWFTSSADGWAVGAAGTILSTTDAGAHWARLTNVPSTDPLFGVRFVTPTYGWAVGGNGAIVRTRDGGATWTKVNPTAAQLDAVSFSDTLNGWAVGETGVIVGTHDGASWYIVQPAVTGLALKGVWRLSNTSAWAGGTQGAAPVTHATADSLAWSLGNVGASNDVRGVMMVDGSTGYMVGSNGSGAVLKTLNGGVSWFSQISNSTQPLNGVWFVDGMHGWAVGASGRIVHTSRGGNN